MKNNYSDKLKIARVLGVVDVVVQVPPGKEAEIVALAAAIVMQRDADRAVHMHKLTQLTNGAARRDADKFSTDLERVNAEK